MLAAGTDMFGNVCRRSLGGAASGNNVVRRAASMVVPVSAIEQAMLSCAGADRPQPITARPTSILDAGMSRSCSALPSVHAAADGILPDLYDGEGLLLPPSPFRSPDFDDDDDDAGCLDGVLASCGYATAPSLPPPSDDAAGGPGQLGHPRPAAAANGHRDRHLALLGDLGQRPDRGGNFVWTSLPSPDDVTPTNENQPHGFGPSGSRLLGPVPPAAAPPLGDKCPSSVRCSDL